MLVYSGNQSVHMWFNVEGWEEREVKAFFGVAKRVNVDPQLLSAVQLVRLPWGWNYKTRQRQKILWLKPEIRGRLELGRS